MAHAARKLQGGGKSPEEAARETARRWPATVEIAVRFLLEAQAEERAALVASLRVERTALHARILELDELLRRMDPEKPRLPAYPPNSWAACILRAVEELQPCQIDAISRHVAAYLNPKHSQKHLKTQISTRLARLVDSGHLVREGERMRYRYRIPPRTS
jgi:hypothetical protein